MFGNWHGRNIKLSNVLLVLGTKVTVHKQEQAECDFTFECYIQAEIALMASSPLTE